MNKARLLAAALACLVWQADAAAFEILTPLSEPCHEWLALGGFDLAKEPFSSPDDESTEGLLASMVERASSAGVPQDAATRGAVRYVADVYGLTGHDPVTQYVLSSLIIGVRDPDTRGFSVVRISVTRSTHIDDQLQDEHSLRRAGDDGQEGNGSAINNILVHLRALMERLHTRWWDGSDQTLGVVWTFPHYGEQDIKVFAPAFLIGSMIHTVQDSFTHMLRDEDARIVHVMNFVEASTFGVVEHRDGFAHSERLDMCFTDDDTFDHLRVSLASAATNRVIRSAEEIASDESFDDSVFVAELDEIYDLRPGCSLENKYCDNQWVDTAREKQSEPLDISIFGCNTGPATPTGSVSWAAPAACGALFGLLWLRRRP